MLSPELWVGAAVGYDKPFVAAMKQMVNTMAWDGQSRTWWFPISYLVHVKQLIREHHLTSDGLLENAYNLIQIELKRRTALKVATSVDGVVKPELVAAYARLGLHPTCSPTLVEWAIILARKEDGQLGAPSTELLHKEEAYRFICAGGAL